MAAAACGLQRCKLGIPWSGPNQSWSGLASQLPVVIVNLCVCVALRWTCGTLDCTTQ